jgi:predicted O-methyltransferase YrrM
MTTLTSDPCKSLIERLFADAEKTQNQWRQNPNRGNASGGDYKDFYMTQAKDVYLAVSRETAVMLYMLARSNNAKNIVEFGTSFGISTIHLAAALKDNGGGKVIGTEFEPGKVAKARVNLAEAGLASYADIREGDALQTLARDLPDSIDLVLLDGAKSLYNPILQLLQPRLRKGALVVSDNADMAPEFVASVRKAGGAFLSVPLADDVELSMKV